MPTSVRRIPLRLTLFVVFVIAAGACASRSADGTTRQRSDPSVMDTTALRRQDYSTVYDAISAQHADWLLPRGGPTGQRTPELGVFIEGSGTRHFGVGYLRSLRPIDVRQVRRLSTTESLHTYSWPWGGLVITLR